MKKHKNNKMMLVLSILLVFLLAGAVSAASDDADTISDDSSSEDVMAQFDSVEQSDTVSTDADDEMFSNADDEILGDEPSGTSFTDLQNYINTASNGSTINLNHDYKFVPEDFRTETAEDDGENKSDYVNYTGIVIKQNNLTIDGNGRVLDASNLARFFLVEGENVTIKNIKFINSNPREVVYSNVDYNKTTEHASDRKGAIFWHGDNGYLNNCSFDNCTANPIMNYGANNSAKTEAGVGAAVCINSVNGLRIDACIFNKCYSNYGAILSNGGSQNIIICNSTFINCTGRDTYGAFGGFNSKNVVFAYNTLINSCLELWINNASVSNCVFNNSAVKLSSEGAVLKDSNFTDYNKTKTIIDIPQNNCKLSGINFDNCNTTSLMETRASGSNLNVLNCTVTNCNCKSNAISINQNGGNVADCTFTNCTSSNNVISINSNGGNVAGCTLTNCTSSNNVISINSNGGNVAGCTLTNCTSSNSIISIDGKKSNVEGCTLSNCTASSNLIGGKGDFDINNIKYMNSTVLNNPFYTFMLNALSQGNTVKLNQSFNVSAPYIITESNVVIDGNGFNLTGKSGIYTVKGNNVTFKNIAFVNATTSLNINGVNGTVDNCTFINCTGTDSLPSAIYMKNGHISNSKFINSTGSYTEGMVVYNNGGIIENCSFTNCSPSSQANTNVLCEIAINCTFDNCKGYGFGGSLRANQVYNSTFKNCKVNSANVNWVGAVILLTGNNAILNNCSFKNCDNKNGLIGLQGSSKITISNCNFPTMDETFGGILRTRDGTFTINIDNCNVVEGNSRLYSDAGNSKYVFNIKNSDMKFSLNGPEFINSTIINSTLYFRNNGKIIDSVIIDSKVTKDFDSLSISKSCIISTNVQNIKQEDNWYGSNDTTGVNNYLELHVDQVDELIAGEWLGALDIYFVKHGTNERVDVLWTRNVTLTIVSGEVVVQNTTTGKHGKIYTNKTGDVTVRVAVDNYAQDFTFTVTATSGFSELQSLINGADEGETLVINNNYTYNPDKDGDLINGIVIAKPINLDFNGFTISGNGTAKGVFNITSDDVVLENLNIKDVNGSAITSAGDNTKINNITAENVNCTVIKITGDDAALNDITVNGSEGTAVEVTGDNTILTNVDLYNHKGEGVVITGDDANVESINAFDATSPALTINGNNSNVTGVALVNQTGIGVIVNGDRNNVSEIVANDGDGTSVVIVGNSNKIEDITGNDHNGTLLSVDGNKNTVDIVAVDGGNGTVVDITGNNTIIGNVVAKGGEGLLVNVVGDNPTVRNISSSNRKGDLLSIDGKGNPDSLNIVIGDVVYPNHAQANVTAIVDGDYIITINGQNYTVTVSDGKGTLTIPDVLDVKEYNATIKSSIPTYIVNANTTFTVNNGTIDLTINVEDVIYNDTAKVIVNASVVGNYNIVVNGTEIKVDFNVNASEVGTDKIIDLGQILPVGKYDVTVTGKIENYNLVNKTVLLSVKADTNVTVTVPEIVEGRNNTQMPINLPSDATGNVVLMVDGKSADTKELVNGSAILNIPELTPGEHNISVVYSGDDKYAGFNKTSGIKTKKESNATVNVPTNIEAGKTTTIPIRLPSDATGNVTLMVDGKAVDTKELVDGSAVLTVPAQSAGKHDISVVYSGDDKYATFNKTTNVDVKSPVPAKKATVITPAKKKYTFKKSKRSQTKTFKVTLKDKDGKKLSGKYVLFKLTKVNKIKLTKKVKKAITKANAKVKKAKKVYKKAKGKKAKDKAKKNLAKAKKALTKAKKPQTMLKELKKGTYKVKTKNGLAKLTLSKNSFVMKKFTGKNIKLTAKFKGDNSYLASSKTVKVVIK